MKNLLNLAKTCEKILTAHNIPICPTISYKVNTRATQRWGCCRVTAWGRDGNNERYAMRCEIEISARLLRDDIPDDAPKKVILHELCHAHVTGRRHGSGWQTRAAQVSKITGYDITRTDDAESLKIPDTVSQLLDQLHKYKITCQHCGNTFYRDRAAGCVKNPSRYHCGKCHVGELTVVEQR